ncbi:hypothetical protein [Nitrosospira sp. NpAV]|uniref:hypothetical protein n=1 Tax=Nitrosospira sp. NpAV TaxID=58133 RepID=UPI0005A11F14|nr:hypothetical protein [Nitrosospira sp. NpAV]KIO50077.1 hypothetical protein SQ11_04095 [Nitrosospira sp. NpAV]
MAKMESNIAEVGRLCHTHGKDAGLQPTPICQAVCSRTNSRNAHSLNLNGIAYGHAIASYGCLAAARWENWIDRRFILQFQELPIQP